MRGSNRLLVNTSTMIDIVQRWVDMEMPKIAEKQKVSNVMVNVGTGANEFEIFLIDRENSNG